MNQPQPAAAVGQGEETQSLRAELQEQSRLADVGELAGQVTHRFNNFLNSLLLKIAVLETELPESDAAKLADVKHQARKMADVIKQVHQLQRRRPPAAGAVDINPLIEQVAHAFKAEAAEASAPVSIRFEPSAQPALTSISAVDFKRLCTFLLRNRLAACPAHAQIAIRAAVEAHKITLAIEDHQSNLPADALAGFFDFDDKGREAGNKLDLAACKALVRRYQGRIQARPSAGGGLIIDVEFPR